MKNRFVVILLFLISFNILHSQKNDFKNDLELAQYYYDISETYYNKNYDSILIYTLLAADCFQDLDIMDLYVECMLGSVNIEMIYKRFGEFESKFNWLVSEVLEKYDIGNEIKATCLNTKSYYYKTIGDYDLAVSFQNEAINLLQEIKENYISLGIGHGNLSTLYSEKGDFKKALLETEIALNYFNQNKESNSDINLNLLASLYFKIGRIQLLQQDLNSSISSFEKSFSIINDLDWAKQKLEMQNEFVSLCISNNLCSIANETIRLIDTNYLDNAHDSLDFIINLLGIKNCLGNEFLKVESATAWRLIEDLDNPVEMDLRLVQLLNTEIENFLILNDFSLESISYVNNKCMKIFKETNWNRSEKLALLKNKLKFQKHNFRYDSTNDIKLILQYFHLASQDIQSESSKLTLGTEYRKVQKLLLSEFDLDKFYSEHFFEILEMNKSSILFAQINESETKSDFVNEDLIEKEEKARRLLIFLEKELATSKSKYESEKTSHDSLILNNLNLELSKASNEYEIIKHEISKKHPEYYDYVLQESYFETSEVQASLDSEEVLLETVFSDDFCTLVFFSRDKVHTIKLENEDFQNFNKQLGLLSKQAFESKGYVGILKSISDQLDLKELEILNGKKRLIIVPDGPLYNLPFELLERDGKNLLQDFSISYQYSYKLLMVLKKHREDLSHKKSFLGVSFPTNQSIASSERVCDDLELSKLSCAKNEIENIETILNRDHSQSDLTTQEFIDASKNARIIHIATHACPDEENHQLSRIHFKDDYLTNYDISAMDLQADLAVLSACETGHGKLIEGEGAMTIARAFFQAGVNTNIVSLWKVDDCSTTELMNYFYQHLVAGEDSDVALQNAKLNFLEKSHPQYHDPYYWAGFIHMGDTAPIFPKSNNAKYLLFAFVGAVALGFGLKGYRSMKGRAA